MTSHTRSVRLSKAERRELIFRLLNCRCLIDGAWYRKGRAAPEWLAELAPRGMFSKEEGEVAEGEPIGGVVRIRDRRRTTLLQREMWLEHTEKRDGISLRMTTYSGDQVPEHLSGPWWEIGPPAGILLLQEGSVRLIGYVRPNVPLNGKALVRHFANCRLRWRYPSLEGILLDATDDTLEILTSTPGCDLITVV
jgi:hypothetical protein